MNYQNKVVALDNPIGSVALEEMNRAGWILMQVVTEKIEVGRDHTDHYKIFYAYAYHHYFTKV